MTASHNWLVERLAKVIGHAHVQGHRPMIAHPMGVVKKRHAAAPQVGCGLAGALIAAEPVVVGFSNLGIDISR
jgi:hypothetical protein